VIGPFCGANQAVRRMTTAHGGTGGFIVDVSSTASLFRSPGEYVDHAAPKGAVDTMTLGLAREVAVEDARVKGLWPGSMETDMHASGCQSGRVERLASAIPMQRGGQPAEVAEAIAWLCSNSASFVTGALLHVSSGR